MFLGKASQFSTPYVAPVILRQCKMVFFFNILEQCMTVHALSAFTEPDVNLGWNY